jgi:hypothetical protein
MNDRAQHQIARGLAHEAVVHHLADHGCWTTNLNIPEDLMAMDEEWLRAAYDRVGLVICEPIQFGSWSNNPVSPAYANLNVQDLVVGVKPTR